MKSGMIAEKKIVSGLMRFKFNTPTSNTASYEVKPSGYAKNEKDNQLTNVSSSKEGFYKFGKSSKKRIEALPSLDKRISGVNSKNYSQFTRIKTSKIRLKGNNLRRRNKKGINYKQMTAVVHKTINMIKAHPKAKLNFFSSLHSDIKTYSRNTSCKSRNVKGYRSYSSFLQKSQPIPDSKGIIKNREKLDLDRAFGKIILSRKFR